MPECMVCIEVSSQYCVVCVQYVRHTVCYEIFQIGAGLYAVGRPVQKRNDEDGQIGTIQSLPLERGASFNCDDIIIIIIDRRRRRWPVENIIIMLLKLFFYLVN